MVTTNLVLDFQKVKEIFHSVVEMTPDEGVQFLNTNCPDHLVRAEVESLLAARGEVGEFLNNISAADTVHAMFDRSDKLIGQKIDNYRVVEEIGRGGMGVVFLVIREDLNQRSALKLIKRGMDSDAILGRFTREREILAALNHPFIARLTDGGTTATDLPYFVMEYVEGLPVDEYCRKNNHSEKKILELFRKICEAVSFAHQKLIVHRDLKPSNILVTPEGIPKLLDFGIAKVLNVTDSDSDTRTNLRVLTPAYASPEQISGSQIDTTSDVYSLGKILAELLKTRQPKSKDLQNILATALREGKERRYRSVEKFSEDIRRYLVGLPISARRDTFSYRTALFIKRKRYSVVVAMLFSLTLFGGLIATLWQSGEARREREIAERRLDNLRNVSGSFVNKIHSAIRDLPGSLPARQMLLTSAVEQLDALALESGDNPALQDDLAQAYFNSAHLPDMLLADKDRTFRKEAAIYEKLITAMPANVHYREQLALTNIELGDIAKVRGSVATSLKFHQTGVSMLEQIDAEEPNTVAHLVNLSSAYSNTAAIYILKGDIADALQTTQRELSILDKIRQLSPDESNLDQLFDNAQIQTAVEKTLSGDYQSGIDKLRYILAFYEVKRFKNPDNTEIAYYLWVINRRLAEALDKSGDVRYASIHLQTALSIIEKLLALSPKDLGYYRNAAMTNISYGQMLVRHQHPSAAIKYFIRANGLSEKVMENDPGNGEAKADLARGTSNLGNAQSLIGKNEESKISLNRAAKIFGEICAADYENAQLRHDYDQSSAWRSQFPKKNRPSDH